MKSLEIKAAIYMGAIALLLTSSGCDEALLKEGVATWMPQSSGGPIETRPLPPARDLPADYKQWLQSDGSAKARLYIATLSQASNQIKYTVSIQKGETGLGAQDTTFASFTYRNPTNGEYQLEWQLRGRHQPDFLKLGGTPKKFLLQPFAVAQESQIPRLKIVGVEGVEARELIVAEPGGVGGRDQ